MGKFGKKVVVNQDLSTFMIGLMAPSGYGKTTLMYQVCDKQFGDDGYILLDMGQENGTKAISGVVAEKVPTWKTMKEIVNDIVKNKATDYPNLKVIVLDTLDATFDIAEQFVVDSYNREHIGETNFRPATSINSVEGGYGRGLDRVVDTVKNEIQRLDTVGVRVWWTSHVKEREQTDLFTGSSYAQLTASMSMKYFNSIKDITHVIGFGYYDRSIEKQEVGDENPITKKKKIRKNVISEDRKIKFRDDSMVADAKSRFASITDEIPLDADRFIKALTDAIEQAAGSEGADLKSSAPITDSTPTAEEVIEKNDDITFEFVENNIRVSDMLEEIHAKWSELNVDTKKQIKGIMDEYNIPMLTEESPAEAVEKIYHLV